MSAGTPKTPAWGGQSRFYLPNEDASALRAALRRLRSRVKNPVFVGGSGMLLLEGARVLPGLETACFVDVAQFQVDYFTALCAAARRSGSARALRQWFCQLVYPELREHFLDRGQDYPLEAVLRALRRRFGVEFLFQDRALARVREALPGVRCLRADILEHLERAAGRHDFVYLSNVPDYLPRARLGRLAAALAAHRAPAYLLVTSACPHPRAVEAAFLEAGFAEHQMSAQLSADNRGLGAPDLQAAWNRPGRIHLYLPPQQGTAA